MSTPTTKLVIYIAPNSGEIYHAQARLYARLFDRWQLQHARLNMRDCYNEQPGHWRECGHMNYEGRLVSFHGPSKAFLELKQSEPLMAGAFFTYEYNPDEEKAVLTYARMEGRKGDFQTIPKEK